MNSSEPFRAAIAQITGLYTQVFNSEGEQIASPADEPRLCRLIKRSPIGLFKCQRDCARCFADGIHSGEPTLFVCHAGLATIAIPVTFSPGRLSDKGLTQVILLGRVLLNQLDEMGYGEIAWAFDLPIKEVFEASKSLRQETLEKLEAAGKVTELIADYLASRSLTLESLETPIFKIAIFNEAISRFFNKKDIQKALPMILGAASVIFDLKECSLLLRHSQSGVFRTVACVGRHESYLHYECGQSDGVMKLLNGASKPFVISDPGQVAQMDFGKYVQSIAAFPFICDGQPEGALLVFNRDWDDEALLTLSSACGFIATRLKNAELHESINQTLHRMSALVKIGEEFSATKDSYHLFEKILEKSKEFLRAKEASLIFKKQNQMRMIIKVDEDPIKEVAEEELKFTAESDVAHSVIRQGKPILVKDVNADPQLDTINPSECKSIISAPLKFGDRCVGSINLIDKLTGEPFNESDLKLLANFATWAAIAIERSRYYEESERLKLLAVTDELTGLYNRRYFTERLHNEIERSKRYSRPLCVAMLDVDDFKSYNDKNGHLLGDRALKKVAQILKDNVRAGDVASRYGGEEFILIFPETTKQEARIIVERVRKGIEDAFSANQGIGLGARLTVSLGIAAYPEDGHSLSELIDKADQAMYWAKLSGKNECGRPQ